MQTQQARSEPVSFPFKLGDLLYWVVKRKDGTVAKFVLVNEKEYPHQTPQQPVKKQLSAFCSHDARDPVFVCNEFALYIGDSSGARRMWQQFDFAIDGGNVLNVNSNNRSYTPLLAGDEDLVAALQGYAAEPAQPPTKVLQIDWNDREAPEVIPEFWVALSKLLYGDVMTCCQGGHGRSGTALAALMLVMSPDYSAQDAIVHLRANHCPRAIESLAQHTYLDTLATYLGRVADSAEAEKVTDYKAAFTSSMKPTAVAFRKFLVKG